MKEKQLIYQIREPSKNEECIFSPTPQSIIEHKNETCLCIELGIEPAVDPCFTCQVLYIRELPLADIHNV